MDQSALLRKYYTEIFPAETLFRVLEITGMRELSFTTQQDAYVRYLSFSTCDSLREKISQLNPKKIDIGAIHDAQPNKLSGAKPIARELVFDIDLTDYTRECCDGKMICERCYEKIKCAVKILDYSLREELGFTQVGFVFSGRRGVHCWVLDGRELDQFVRLDIYKFFHTIIEKNQFVQKYYDIMSEFTSDEKSMIQNWFIRIDKPVTVGMNHLIKAPFSVHPETLNISIPLDPSNIVEFKDLITLGDVIADPAILQPFIDLMESWRMGRE